MQPVVWNQPVVLQERLNEELDQHETNRSDQKG